MAARRKSSAKPAVSPPPASPSTDQTSTPPAEPPPVDPPAAEQDQPVPVRKVRIRPAAPVRAGGHVLTERGWQRET